jgi:hypothetical protein
VLKAQELVPSPNTTPETITYEGVTEYILSDFDSGEVQGLEGIKGASILEINSTFRSDQMFYRTLTPDGTPNGLFKKLEGVAGVDTLTQVGDNIISFTGATTKILNLSVNGDAVTLDSAKEVKYDGVYRYSDHVNNENKLYWISGYSVRLVVDGDMTSEDPANFQTSTEMQATNFAEIFGEKQGFKLPSGGIVQLNNFTSSNTSYGTIQVLGIRNSLTSPLIYNTEINNLSQNIDNTGRGVRTLSGRNVIEINDANINLSEKEQTKETIITLKLQVGNKIMTVSIPNPLFVEPLICETNQHIENGVCELNSKMVNCDENNNNPENSVDILENVEVNWVNDSWETAELCDFECITNYHLETLLCISNTKQVECNNNNENPANSRDILIDLTINWNENTQEWEEIPLCAWACDTAYHNENGLCVSNIKEVECESGLNPENSVEVIENVEITWNGNSWSEAPECRWNCIDGFHEENGACVENTLQCEANQHEENGVCVSNIKIVECISGGNPENSTEIIENVEINWVNNSWESPKNCDWECNDGYTAFREGASAFSECVEIVTDLCENVECNENQHCESESGLCVCDEGYKAVREGGSAFPECVEDTIDSDYDKMLALIEFSGEEYITIEKINSNNLFKGIDIKNISENHLVTIRILDGIKIYLKPNAGVVIVAKYVNDEIQIDVKAFELYGEAEFIQHNHESEIKYNRGTGTSVGLSLSGTVVHFDENENLHLTANPTFEDDLNRVADTDSKVYVDLNNDGITDVIMDLSKYDGDIMLDLDSGEMFVDGELVTDDIDTKTPNSEGCSYSNQNNSINPYFFLFFMIFIVIRKRKKASKGSIS